MQLIIFSSSLEWMFISGLFMMSELLILAIFYCGMAYEFANVGLSYPSTRTGSVLKKKTSNHLRETN